MGKFGRVAVLYGGTSSEKDISIKSGTAVLEALKRQGVDATGIDAEGEQLRARLIACQADCCVIMFHGRYGEGGGVQALLDEMGLPYSGSDATSSATGMDKPRCKTIWRQAGLPTPEAELLEGPQQLPSLAYPLAIKPVADGSSLGVHYVRCAEEVPDAYADAARYGAVMAEKWIQGRELTVSIVKGEALPVMWIRSATGFYDYQAKYLADSTEYLFPDDLAPELLAAVQQTAVRAFELIGCQGWGRVDFMLDDSSQQFYLLELNTVPGMTDHSLVPKAARRIGWSFDRVVMEILSTAVV